MSQSDVGFEALGRQNSDMPSLRTCRTSLLHHAFDHQIARLAAELPDPHIDDGYLTREDSKGGI